MSRHTDIDCMACAEEAARPSYPNAQQNEAFDTLMRQLPRKTVCHIIGIPVTNDYAEIIWGFDGLSELEADRALHSMQEAIND